jgi:hypothetical protein
MLALTENSCATPTVVFDNMYRTFDSILNADLNITIYVQSNGPRLN